MPLFRINAGMGRPLKKGWGKPEDLPVYKIYLAEKGQRKIKGATPTKDKSGFFITMKKAVWIAIILTALLPKASFAALRIVSLAPSTTEILFALNLDDEIVGVSSFCDYPLQAKKKEKVGSFSRPNIEKIISLKPDIVFCTGLEQAPVIYELRQLNINVFISDPANIKELFSSIMEIGGLTGRREEAAQLVEEMRAQIQKITAKTESIPEDRRPTVFVEYWNNPLMTVGQGSFVDELITLAGGRNIAYGTKRPYSYFSPELVISRNPDCIILAYMVNEEAAQTIRGRLGWQDIAAVKNGRIYGDIDSDLILRPGPRIVLGLAEIHKRLYP